MANISQIEINGATYDLVDATARNQYNNLIDYYLCGDNINVDSTSYSPNHARFLLNKDLGMVTGGDTTIVDTTIYSFYMWQDTGNIRSDKYDINTDTNTTRGYVPLSRRGTKDCVNATSGTSLITAASEWTITTCSISRWGQIVEMNLAAKRNATFSINAQGGTGNSQIGVLKDSANWPAIEAGLRSNGDPTTVGAAWGYINTSGQIVVTAFDGTGTARTLAANTVIHLGGSWIANMTNNF